MRRLAVCTALRAGAFLEAAWAADLAAALAEGLPTVFKAGLLVGLLDFGADLAGALAAGLADLAGAFNAGLALASGLATALLAAGVLPAVDLAAALREAFFGTAF